MRSSNHISDVKDTSNIRDNNTKELDIENKKMEYIFRDVMNGRDARNSNLGISRTSSRTGTGERQQDIRNIR